ncbi:hypothetical protein ACIP4Q_28745 [Streptomyces massasporeus]
MTTFRDGPLQRQLHVRAQGADDPVVVAQVVPDVRVVEHAAMYRRASSRGLPDPGPPKPLAPKLPDHPAYQQIMAVFTAADHPLRARQVCEAMDLAVAPDNINNVRQPVTNEGITAPATAPCP